MQKIFMPSKPATERSVRPCGNATRYYVFSDEGLCRVTGQTMVWHKKIIPVNARRWTSLPVLPNLKKAMMVVVNNFGFYTVCLI